MMKPYLFALLGFFSILGCRKHDKPIPVPCPFPEEMHGVVMRSIQRSSPGYTEGLIFDNGRLLESTGGYHGESVINAIDLKSGKVSLVRKTPLDSFGEGLARLGDEYYQLIYKENWFNVYKAQDFSLKAKLKFDFNLFQGGWGLTTLHDQYLAMSDGSDQIYIADKSGHLVRQIQVRDDTKTPYSNLNTLQSAGDFIYANIWHSDEIYRINAETGCVLAILDVNRDLEFPPSSGGTLAAWIKSREKAEHKNYESVLNGIAYTKDSDSFFITGKNWPLILELKIK